MKNKLLVSIVFCMSLLTCLFLTGCGISEVVEVTVKGNAYSEFVQGQNIDDLKNRIEVTIKFKDGTEKTVKGNEEGVEITNFSTANPTLNGKMTIKYSDGESSADCVIDYVVYSHAQTIKSTADIDKISNQTSADDQGILFFAENLTYDMVNLPITRDLKLVARTGVNVILKDVTVKPTKAKSDLNVSFSNITFQNNKTGGTFYFLNCNDGVTYKTNLTITKCNFLVANGIASGISFPVRGDVVVSECSFKTETNTDCFSYILNCNSSTRNFTDKITISKNTIDCNFAYCFGNVQNATLDGNYINCTLQNESGIGSYAESSSAQTQFVARKNPTILHNSFHNAKRMPTGNEKFVLKFTNNIVRNAQSLIRSYKMDLYDFSTFDYDFTGTTIENCAVLVISSSETYTTMPKLVSLVKSQIKTGYILEYKAVIVQDSVIQIASEGLDKITTTNGSALYYDLTKAENEKYATIRIEDEEYTYIGSASSKYYIKDAENHFYCIDSVKYSPEGDILFFKTETSNSLFIADAKVYALDGVGGIKEIFGLN